MPGEIKAVTIRMDRPVDRVGAPPTTVEADHRGFWGRLFVARRSSMRWLVWIGKISVLLVSVVLLLGGAVVIFEERETGAGVMMMLLGLGAMSASYFFL